MVTWGGLAQDFQRALLTTDAAAKYALGDTLAALLPLCGAAYRKASYDAPPGTWAHLSGASGVG